MTKFQKSASLGMDLTFYLHLTWIADQDRPAQVGPKRGGRFQTHTP